MSLKGSTTGGRSIAILGASGFMGRHLVNRFVQDGHAVRALVRGNGGDLANKASVLTRRFDEPTHFREALDDVDAVVHVAARNTVASSHDAPMKELDQDLRSSAALVEALHGRSDIHAIYVSSGGTIYGDSLDSAPFTEDAAKRPKSYYGAGKVAAEMFLGAWAARHEGRLTIVRPSNIFGPGQVPHAGFGVVPTLLECLYSGSPFCVRGSPSSLRDYVYIDDFVDLMARIVNTGPSDSSQAVNAASGFGVSLGELTELAQQVTGRSLETRETAPLDAEVANVVLDTRKARALYGWAPQTSLESGLRETWEWFKEIQKGADGAG